jgi:adenine phosphoribosyltransferase
MDFGYYDKRINKKTRLRYDITPLFGEKEVFRNLISDMAKLFDGDGYEIIAGIDALGFILGAAMAQKLGKGFVPVRKGGKLPGVTGTVIKSSFTDYTGKKKSLEMSRRSIKWGEKVLIVDDWIETGSQVKAAIKLIEKQGGKVAGIAAISAERSQRTRMLFEVYGCRALRVDEKHFTTFK